MILLQAAYSIAHPQNGWWLLALVPMALGWWAYARWKKKTLAKLADQPLLAGITATYSPRKWRLQQTLMLVAVALLALGMLSLQQPVEKGGAQVEGMEVVLAIDVSTSMLSADASPSRLEQARLIATKLTDTLQGSKVAVVAFAGEAWLQLPLTTDLQAARLLISGLDGKAVPLEGTDLQLALQTAAESLPIADPAHKAVVLLTDGEELEGDAMAAAEALQKAGVMLITVGIGTPNGIVLKDGTGLPVRDENGEPVVSKLNEKLLQQLAAQTGGRYLPPATAQAHTNAVLAILRELPKSPMLNSYLVNYYSYSHWLIALALLLIIVATALTEKRSKKKIAAVAACIMVLILPIATTAQTNTNSQLQQADALYQQGKLDEAAALYAEVLKANPSAWMAGMHLGNIAYKKGDYEKAVSQYQAMLQKAGNDARAKAMLHNNVGLAQAHHKQLKEAVGSFKQALKYQPDDAEISRNLNIALDELKKQQQQQQPQQNPDNNKQQQKANDQLKALQQEEKRIRQQMQQQKKSAKLPGRKSW